MSIDPLLRAPTDLADPQALVLKDLQTRLQRLERLASGVPESVGFYVVRTSNEAGWPTGTFNAITFTNIRANSGFLPTVGWGGASSFVVPVGFGGLYELNAGMYWAGFSSNIWCTIRVNGIVVIAADGTSGTYDRRYIGGQPVVLKAGDVVDVYVGNLSGVTLTITAYPGDTTATPPVPYLSVWRVG